MSFWEYKSAAADELNDLGAQGWEAVCMLYPAKPRTDRPGWVPPTLLLKRPTPPPKSDTTRGQ